MTKTAFAPREVFEQMLEFMPIPTFDLIIQYGDEGVIVAKRKIAPYKNVWALPGLRMYKGESINDTLQRIAADELGLEIPVAKKQLVGQYVGKFSTENNRQDISTAYAVKVDKSQPININTDHFSQYKIVKTVPESIGSMYKYYLEKYFSAF